MEFGFKSLSKYLTGALRPRALQHNETIACLSPSTAAGQQQQERSAVTSTTTPVHPDAAQVRSSTYQNRETEHGAAT